jgi:hypothetical protein
MTIKYTDMKKIINIFLLGFLAVGLSSCLKDKSLIQPDADGAISNLIEFQNIGAITSGTSSPFPVYEQSYDAGGPASLSVVVNYAGVNTAPRDINVTVAVDPTIITKYNAKIVADARAAAIVLGQDPDEAEDDVAGDLFDILDPAVYTPGSLNLVIPAGQRTATLNVALLPGNFDFSKNAAIAFKIVSASEGPISGNFGNIIVKVSAKNKYDGTYGLSGRASGSPTRTNVYQAGEFTWPGNVELRTSAANVVDMYDDYYNWGGGISQWILLLPSTATTGGGFGSSRPRFTLDPATNKVISVVNAFPNPANGRAFAIDPSFDSKFDPASKTLELQFFFTQPGFAPLTVRYKFTYQGAR